MNIESTGKIVSVLQEQRGQGKNGEWVKNGFVIEYDDNGYTQKLCLEVMGEDKWEKMKGNVVVGKEVLVKFSVSSREWNSRWFTTANCFYCGAVGGQQTQQPTTQQPQPSATSAEDDVPF